MKELRLKKYRKWIGLIGMLAIIGLPSCNLKEDRIDGETAKQVREELNNREFRKISEGEITAEAMGKGRLLVSRIADSLKSQLMRAVEQEGVSGALKYCNVAAVPLTKRLTGHLDAEVVRVSSKNRNPDNIPQSEIEQQLLEAYEYSVKSGNTDLDPITQILDTTILYTAPIFANKMCLKCHGVPEKDIQSEDYVLLKELYPEGKATGYKEGDFRGMWIVRFNKKELIKNMVVEKP